MKTGEDIESYLIQMDAHYELVGEDIWVIKDQGPDIVVTIGDPVVVIRVKVMDTTTVAKEKLEALYKKLLTLNATEMMHGAYGLEEGAVVVTAALQLENLDYNELQAALDDVSLAVSNHYQTLSKLAA